jgi:nicotinamidase-related amidase
MKTALLIIDVQMAAFTRQHRDGKALHRSQNLIANLQKLICGARGAGAPVIYFQQINRTGVLAKDSPLIEIHPDIAPAPEDSVIRKHHPDAFHGTDLQQRLETLGVSHLVMAGIQTEYCVDATCRRAHSLGYHCTLVADAHSTFDSKTLTAEQIIAHHNELLGGVFLKLKKTDEVIWNGEG